MHERRQRMILYYAVSGRKTPVWTPVEQKLYDSFRKGAAEHPGAEWIIPTSLPDNGIEMRYAGANGEGLTLETVEKLSEKAEKVIGILESDGMTCEDGSLTVAFEDTAEKQMAMKIVRFSHYLAIPSFGCAVPGQLEEQLAYGIAAYTMRNFCPDEAYAMKTLEEIVCRVVSVYILRRLNLPEKAEEVLRCGGTPFKCDLLPTPGERAGNTGEDIRKLSGVFRKEDVVPFLLLREYARPDKHAEGRSLNTEALRANYPESRAVQMLCDIAKRIESDRDRPVDDKMTDPGPARGGTADEKQLSEEREHARAL